MYGVGQTKSLAVEMHWTAAGKVSRDVIGEQAGTRSKLRVTVSILKGL